MNTNKNHKIVLRALAEISDKCIYYAIAGKGDQEEKLRNMAAELGISTRFRLLGYRTDVAELYKMADVYALPSIREGLNVSVMEALASGLPCLVSKIRGNVDMIQENKNGYYINPLDTDSVIEGIQKVWNIKIGEDGKEASAFDYKSINRRMFEIYDLAR